MLTIDDHINILLQSKRSVRFKELQRILFELGFQMRQQKRGGSHYVFKRPALLKEYLKYDYPVRIVREPDGLYCAEITEISGLCAYGKSSAEALEQLDEVKEAAFELMVSQGEEPPQPTIRLEIPENIFRKIPGRKLLKRYVKV